MKILLYYDYVCPFCFLATERVLVLAEEFGLETRWLGIEIRPGLPSEGKPRKKTPKTLRTVQTLRSAAEEAGVRVRLPGFVASSRLCLEGAEFAREKGRFMEFHEACYEAYFGEKKNIGLLETVLEAGRTAGLSEEELSAALRERRFSEAIEKNMESARENQVFGVPTLLLGGMRVHGIQTEDAYRKLIEKELRRKRALH